VSQENVAVVRRATEALNAGNPRAFLDLYDADILLRVTAESFISPGTVVGAAAVERFFDDFYTTFSRGCSRNRRRSLRSALALRE